MKSILIPLVLLLVGAGLGFGAARPQSQQLSQEVQRLQAQIEQARKVLPVTPAEMQSIGGTVTGIGADTVTLEISAFNPFDDFATTRTVVTNATTKFVLLKQKDEARYREEVAAYQESIRNGTYAQAGSPAAPNPFTESVGAFSDIQQGQFASVSADHNIRDEARVTATEVRITMPADTR